MRGYPKNLNSKEDYEFVRANFPAEQWLPDWQNLLESRFVWLPTGPVESEEAGIVDDTHKVVASETEEGKTEYTQYELSENRRAKIFRIGFTVEEVEQAIASAASYVPSE